MPDPVVRPSNEADLPAITAVYAWHVEHGTGTFELDAPDLAEMTRRRSDVLANGWPWLVAEREGALLGFAYANVFRPRRAYRYCVEDSVYVANDARSQGIGHALLSELIAQCESGGARQILAVIGDSANAASIKLHQRLGFAHAGLMRSAGFKLGAWRDVVLMQRALGTGDSDLPETAP